MKRGKLVIQKELLSDGFTGNEFWERVKTCFVCPGRKSEKIVMFWTDDKDPYYYVGLCGECHEKLVNEDVEFVNRYEALANETLDKKEEGRER